MGYQRSPGTAPIAAWPELSVVQCWFQSIITNPSGVDAAAEAVSNTAITPLARGDLEAMITRSENLTASERISIYANAYYARLIECMGDTFPVLKRALGHEAFNGFVFGYLQEYPSRSYTLARLGSHFVDYLASTKPSITTGEDGLPADWSDFFVDLARLELTIAMVFDGPGVENSPEWDPAHFQQFIDDTFEKSLLEVSPCLVLLATRYPVNDFYTVSRNSLGNESIRPPAPRVSFTAISRLDYIVRRYNLSRCQYELLSGLQDGLPLGVAVGRAAEFSATDEEHFVAELAQWFELWTRDRFFRPCS